jgi:hypothetical protein
MHNGRVTMIDVSDGQLVIEIRDFVALDALPMLFNFFVTRLVQTTCNVDSSFKAKAGLELKPRLSPRLSA